LILGHTKSLLINGETPEEDNAQQASESCAAATTERRDPYVGCNSLFCNYNLKKKLQR